MKPVRVAFYCSSTSLGGLELNVARLASWLSAEGCEIYFGGAQNSPLLKRLETLGTACKSFRQNRNYYDFPAAYNVLRWMKQKKCRILFVHDTRDISLAAAVKFFSGNQIKALYQQQMQIGVNKRDILHTLRYRSLDAWITPLHWLKNQILERTRYPAQQIHIAPLGVDAKALELNETREECRELFGLPQNAFTLGILGRIDDGKGQDFLIEVVQQMKNEAREVHLLMVGEPTLNKHDGYPEKLDKMIADYGLAEQVHRHPFLERTGLFFKAIDAFAMASVGETYGMVTVEAMMCGVPVIGTNTGGTPELLDFGKCGLLYSPGNHLQFKVHLTRLLENRQEAVSLSESARLRAEQHYAKEIQVKKVMQVLQSLL